MAKIAKSYEFLNKIYDTRKLLNSKYSYRNFARDLDIPANRLLDFLKGKSGISQKRAEEISAKLNLSKSESEYFCNLVDAEFNRSKKNKNDAKKRLIKYKYKEIQNDIFAIISKWYHFAILEMTHLDFFENNNKWIAEQLHISEKEVADAIQRMINLKMLELTPNNKLVDTLRFITTEDNVPSDAVKKGHIEILEKSTKVIDKHNLSKNDFNSEIIAIDNSDIKNAKRDIQTFVKNFNTKFLKSTGKNSIYCLNVSFFDLEKH